MARNKNKGSRGKRNDKGYKYNNSHNTRNADSDSQLFRSESPAEEDDKGYRGRSRGNRPKANNDVSWYTTNPDLIASTANIPFNQITGLQLDRDWMSWDPSLLKNVSPNAPVNTNQNPISTTTYMTNVIPGVMAIELTPSIGYADNPSDPINLSALAMYSYIRHANSGTAYGDPADTMIFMLAMSQVYSYINYLQRIYGTVSLYSQVNRYLPVALVKAQRVDFQSVAANMADFRYGINLLINKAASFAVPQTFTYFKRQAFMYSNYYTDGESMRDQLYLFVPRGFWFYSEGTEQDPAGRLNFGNLNEFMTSGSDVLTYQQLLNIGDQMIGNLLRSEDIGILSGNILKAFGENNLVKLAPLPEDYTLLPVYDIGVLEQIRNATVLDFGGFVNGVGVAITQNKQLHNGALIHRPTISFTMPGVEQDGNIAAFMGSLLTSHFNTAQLLLTGAKNPTINDIVENTRLKVGIDPRYGTQWNASVSGDMRFIVGVHPGSDMVTGIKVYQADYKANQSLGSNFIDYKRYGASFVASMSNVTSTLKAPTYRQVLPELLRDVKFDFRPTFTVYDIPGNTVAPSSAIDVMGFDVEMENYTVINNAEINRLNDACLVNEFYVPSVGSL